MLQKVTLIERQARPINFTRAMLTGMFSSALMMSVVDVFNMWGITPFSFEVYLGALVRRSAAGTHTWTVGLLANWVAGAIFGLFYALIFEFVFKRSSVRLGIYLGAAHALIAALVIFPVFGFLQVELGTGLSDHFGFFGSGFGAATPLILLFSHLLFGACMGLFYGPVRYLRLHMKKFEPGESGAPGETKHIITEDEDPKDSQIINW